MYGKYFRDVRHLQSIDIYQVLRLFDVSDHALGHAVKKILLAGTRTGNKSFADDIQEARDTLDRWLNMEDERCPVNIGTVDGATPPKD